MGTYDLWQLHVIVHGRVQGVSFRYHTQRRADELSVTGWVRNLPDRMVELRAEGTRDQLEQLLAFLRQGPPAAHVLSVDVNWRKGVGSFTTFEIIG